MRDARQPIIKENNGMTRKEYNKKYRETHREEIRAYQEQYQKQYYKKHVEKIRKYYEEHREEIQAREKQYNVKRRDRKAEYDKEYRAEHRGDRERYREEHRADQWASQVKLRYGVSPEDYDQMLVEQDGCCAICGRHQTKFKERLCIDHNHETGIVRGLLCRRCNLLLGHAHDSVTILQLAIDYLKRMER